MSKFKKYELINNIQGITPYIKCHGDEYFRKGWFSYVPIEGPDGTMSSGAMVHGPKFKAKRNQIFTRRGDEIIPGWGTIAGNLTLTSNFEQDLMNVLSQDNIEAVFWVNDQTDEVEAICFDDSTETTQVH